MIIRREYFANYPYCIYLIDSEECLSIAIEAVATKGGVNIDKLRRLNFNIFDPGFWDEDGVRIDGLKRVYSFPITYYRILYSSFLLVDTRILRHSWRK
ncbi:hypothetical protein C8R27_11180 [Nitrosomonas ureae]|nr:hypothetical protein C8R27_11180 [Nitrosomonas ureae]